MQQLAPALTPRSQRRQQKIQDILDAAMALVIERGIESLTIQAIAKDTDYTPGALYRYFGSKDEILAALDIQVLEHFSRIFERSLAVGREYLVTHPLPVAAAALFPAVLFCDVYRQLAELQPRHFHLLCILVSTPKPWVKDTAAIHVIRPSLQILSTAAEVLDNAARVDALSGGEALERAFLLWSCVHALLERKKLGRLLPTTVAIPQLHDSLVHTLLCGWGAAPEALHQATTSVKMLNTKSPIVALYLQQNP